MAGQPPAADDAAARTITELTSGPDLVQLDVGRPGIAWGPRRTVAFAVLAPLVLWSLLDSSHPLWALVPLAIGAGLALASYVPLRGESMATTLGSTCSAVGGIVPLACAASSLASPGTGSLVLGSGFVAFALYQRFGSGGACAAPSR